MAENMMTQSTPASNPARRAVPRVLTIAGTDPTGGAGIQADIKAITEAGGFALSVVTAVVSQNTRGVREVHGIDEHTIGAQLSAVVDDVEVDGVKIGMLGTAATARAVGEFLDEHDFPVVVLDPVMVATSGDRLLDEDAEGEVIDLCRRVDVITPNLKELAVLARAEQAGSLDEGVAQAKPLAAEWGTTIVVKGGHLTGREAGNVAVAPDGSTRAVSARRIDTTTTHGTGCTLSSALATRLAAGEETGAALEWATRLVHEALAAGEELGVGKGNGPLDHSHRSRRLAAAADTSPWPAIAAAPEEIDDPAEVGDLSGEGPEPHVLAAGPWTEALWRAGRGVYRETLELQFIRQLADGSLPESQFRFYLSQDARYLEEYSGALAALTARAFDPADGVAWARSAQQCLDEEAELHRTYLHGETHVPLSPVTLAYTSSLKAATLGRDYAVGAAAVLPCFWIYAEVGLDLAKNNSEDHPYTEWLSAYGDGEFLDDTRAAVERVERALAGAGPKARAEALRQYLYAAYYEREFFAQATRASVA
ncbi:bifunctional hydroxymethylpyrimidine kinase/phosphomethylpyrimidine kinase [Corynebacterium otitidis]|nr:bifunctional hydroxymethylpyrimidine kinase/phosphomethylpyrimidine kinase [Corynebacterium otitidis]